MKKKVAALCVAFCLSTMAPTVYAADPPYDFKAGDNLITGQGDRYEDEDGMVLHLSVDEAVAFGIDHNKDLINLAYQLKLANVKQRNAIESGKSLKEAKKDLETAEDKLKSKE